MKKLFIIACTTLLMGGVSSVLGQDGDPLAPFAPYLNTTNTLLEQKVKLTLKGTTQKEIKVKKAGVSYTVKNFRIANKDLLALFTGADVKSDIIVKTYQTWYQDYEVVGENEVFFLRPWVWQRVYIVSGTSARDITEEMEELLSLWPISYIWTELLDSGAVTNLIDEGVIVKGNANGDNFVTKGNITCLFTTGGEGDIPVDNSETDAVEVKQTWDFDGVLIDAKYNVKANTKKGELKINSAKHVGKVHGDGDVWTHTPAPVDQEGNMLDCPPGSWWVFQFGVCSSSKPFRVDGKYTVNGKEKLSLSDVTPPAPISVPLPE